MNHQKRFMHYISNPALNNTNHQYKNCGKPLYICQITEQVNKAVVHFEEVLVRNSVELSVILTFFIIILSLSTLIP